MTAMTKVNELAHTALTVGQVAEQLGVTVRTLHHYDAIVLRLCCMPRLARQVRVTAYRRVGEMQPRDVSG